MERFVGASKVCMKGQRCGWGEETALGFRVDETSGLAVVAAMTKNEGRASVNTVGNVVGHSVGSAVGAHRS